MYTISEAVIQTNKRPGDGLLCTMFSPADSTHLATGGDSGARIIDIRHDPNRLTDS